MTGVHLASLQKQRPAEPRESKALDRGFQEELPQNSSARFLAEPEEELLHALPMMM